MLKLIGTVPNSKEYGISVNYLLQEFNVNSSTYYYKTTSKQYINVLPKKSNVKPLGFCYTLSGKKT
jgi:hypothetical protein